MILASLSSDTLSPERCDVIGAMRLCALANPIFACDLAGGPQSRLHIYLDEYPRFATPRLPTHWSRGGNTTLM